MGRYVKKLLKMHFRGTHLGNTWLVVLERHIGTLPPKSSQAKTLPDTDKTGDL